MQQQQQSAYKPLCLCRQIYLILFTRAQTTVSLFGFQFKSIISLLLPLVAFIASFFVRCEKTKTKNKKQENRKSVGVLIVPVHIQASSRKEHFLLFYNCVWGGGRFVFTRSLALFLFI
jgi:hypothetical protein